MIIKMVEDIKRSCENKAYVSALALILTIPDICGKIQYKEDSGLNDKDKYIKWFNEWVKNFFEIPESGYEKYDNFDKLIEIDGDLCYLLRCSCLHAGNLDLKKNSKKNIKIDKLQLCVCKEEWQYGDVYSHYTIYSINGENNEEINGAYVRLNVINFIKYFICGIENYIKIYGDISDENAVTGIIEF